MVSADCVIIITDYTSYDWQEVVDCSPLIVDTRHATRDFNGLARRVWL